MTEAIALVPARCGSKSIPLKNSKNFCGKPLIYWTLKALQESKSIDRIILATDCESIAEIAISLQFSKLEIFKRRPENATDHASTESVMLEVIESLNLNINSFFNLVQATSPFLTSNDIDSTFELLKNKGYDSVLSCVRNKRFFWNSDGAFNYNYKNRPRRQDFEGQLMENGAIYVSSVENIVRDKNRLSGKIGIYEMPEYTAIEIDEEDDWLMAEMIMKKHVLSKQITKKKIRLFATDVDGVLTDGGMYYGENGEEQKKFNTIDGKGFELLRNRNIKTAILTSENTKIVSRRAEKLKIDYLFQGELKKLAAIKKLSLQLKIPLEEIAYVGDDVNDKELLENIGFAACPQNALQAIKNIPNILILEKKGGEGAVREFIDQILELQNP